MAKRTQRSGDLHRTGPASGLSWGLSVKKSAHRTAVRCSCRVPSLSDGEGWQMQNPVDLKNPAIHRRITGFESLLYDRLCRGRYSDLGSISHALLYCRRANSLIMSTSLILWHYIGRSAMILPEVSWIY